MDRAEYISAELAGYERAWRDGHFPALSQAVTLCVETGTALPDWAGSAVISHLNALFDGSVKGAGKRGNSGGPRASAEMDEVHFLRWAWVSHWIKNIELLPTLGHKATKTDAYALVAESFADSLPHGSKLAVNIHQAAGVAVRSKGTSTT